MRMCLIRLFEDREMVRLARILDRSKHSTDRFDAVEYMSEIEHIERYSRESQPHLLDWHMKNKGYVSDDDYRYSRRDLDKFVGVDTRIDKCHRSR